MIKLITSNCFHNFKYVFLEKGVKVIRSCSEILSIIKSYDNTPTKSVSEAVQSTINPIQKCDTPLIQIPQNVPKKLLKPIGPKRILKPNVPITPQVPIAVDQQEIKEISTQPVNSLGSKKFVSIRNY